MSEINTAEFMRAFDAGVARAEQGFNDAFRAMVLQLFTGIVKRWPVDTGRSRGNWQISINRMDTGELDVEDKRGQRTITKAGRVVDGAKNVNDVFIHNNTSYAERLENGWSDQAPSGAVRVTLTEFEQKLRAAARDNQL